MNRAFGNCLGVVGAVGLLDLVLWCLGGHLVLGAGYRSSPGAFSLFRGPILSGLASTLLFCSPLFGRLYLDKCLSWFGAPRRRTPKITIWITSTALAATTIAGIVWACSANPKTRAADRLDPIKTIEYQHWVWVNTCASGVLLAGWGFLLSIYTIVNVSLQPTLETESSAIDADDPPGTDEISSPQNHSDVEADLDRRFSGSFLADLPAAQVPECKREPFLLLEYLRASRLSRPEPEPGIWDGGETIAPEPHAKKIEENVC